MKSGGRRRNLHQGALVSVTEVFASADEPPTSGYSPDFQVVLPYQGLFGFQVGRRFTLVDANRTLFVSGGQTFADSHPVPGLGHASLIVAPTPAVLQTLCDGTKPADHAAFRDASRTAGPRIRLMTHALRRILTAEPEPLRGDELIMTALREALGSGVERAPRNELRVVDRAKQVLHAFGFERLTLDRISREVGVTPTYLTQAFSQAEGVPLYRYQLNLRLNQALIEAPHRDDLTALALDLGFSSHGHFSTAFKAAFGVSPSRYRDDPGCLARVL